MKKRKIEIGQLWAAVFNQDGKRFVGYTFEIIRSGKYHGENGKIKTAWLGIKSYMRPHPEEDADMSHCYWFDESGVAVLVGGGVFTFTRRRYEVRQPTVIEGL